MNTRALDAQNGCNRNACANIRAVLSIPGKGPESFSITINDEVDLARLPGLVVMQGTDRFTGPQSDENGHILGFIRYDEEVKPSGSFEGSQARFVIEIFGFDLNLLASFVPAIRPEDKLQLVLKVFDLERSSLPDGWFWPSSTVQDSGAILVYDVAVKIGSQSSS